MSRWIRAAVVTAAMGAAVAVSAPAGAAVVPPPMLSDTWRAWSNGPNPTGDPRVWPIGVWEQNPGNAEGGRSNALNYSGIGVTTDVNGYGDLAAAKAAGWAVWQYPGDNYENMADPVAQAWEMGDEPDMLPGSAWARPAQLLHNVNIVRAKDPTRPVHVNFGKGMTLDHWYGYVPEVSYDADMATYCQATDVASGDYYSFSDENEAWQRYRGAWTYGRVVANIHARCGAGKLALGMVETAELNGHHVTPEQVEQAAWSQVVHGANGIVWFAHAFGPGGEYIAEDMLLRDPPMAAKVAALDAQFTKLAPVLNSPDVPGTSVTSTGGIPVAFVSKRQGGHRWLLAQADGDRDHNDSGPTTAVFRVPEPVGLAVVVGEDRTVPIIGHRLVDTFGAYGHHVYRITP